MVLSSHVRATIGSLFFLLGSLSFKVTYSSTLPKPIYHRMARSTVTSRYIASKPFYSAQCPEAPPPLSRWRKEDSGSNARLNGEPNPLSRLEERDTQGSNFKNVRIFILIQRLAFRSAGVLSFQTMFGASFGDTLCDPVTKGESNRVLHHMGESDRVWEGRKVRSHTSSAISCFQRSLEWPWRNALGEV